jgi:hypothetical protein
MHCESGDALSVLIAIRVRRADRLYAKILVVIGKASKGFHFDAGPHS